MLRNKKIVLILVSVLLLLGTGCKKFLDVNENLNQPPKVPTSTLLTTAERNIGDNLSFGGISLFLSVYMHQMTTRETANQYGVKGTDVDAAWDGLYLDALDNLDIIISQGTEEDNMVYVGIAKILRAYTFSQMVDIWGDVPYSEYNHFKGDIRQPKFDKGSDIYPQLLTMLDEGIGDIENSTAANISVPGANDVIYAGSKTNWVKAANTIKLKLYTQLRNVQDVSSEVTALLSDPTSLIDATDESFMLPYGPLGATDDRNPGFGDYIATQRSNNISPWFYEIMKGYNPNINTGIVDPRIPYYIFDQIGPDDEADNSTEYRDGAFISIYFGSTGPYRDGSQQNSLSLFGIYPVGGRYDDGEGGTADASSGTGAAPYRFITYADRLYLEAELINTGVVTGDAREVFEKAMQASMEQVDYVISDFVKPNQTVPPLVGSTEVDDYITAILGQYDAASDSKKLEYIMTQKWLSSVGSSVDQYTDYRRTGYPILFDPANPAMAPGGFVQPPLGGNPFQDPQLKVPVTLSIAYPQSLPWSQDELDLNGNAPAQKAPATFKVFWEP